MLPYLPHNKLRWGIVFVSCLLAIFLASELRAKTRFYVLESRKDSETGDTKFDEYPKNQCEYIWKSVLARVPLCVDTDVCWNILIYTRLGLPRKFRANQWITAPGFHHNSSCEKIMHRPTTLLFSTQANSRHCNFQTHPSCNTAILRQIATYYFGQGREIPACDASTSSCQPNSFHVVSRQSLPANAKL